MGYHRVCNCQRNCNADDKLAKPAIWARNYFAASIMIFTFTSWACGNATSIEELIIFRFIQGIGDGALLVTAQTIITENYPIEKRAMAQTFMYLVFTLVSKPIFKMNTKESIRFY